MFTIHNKALSDFIRSRYSRADVRNIRTLLDQHGTFHFPALDNGLFPAASLGRGGEDISGYHYVWVRDNVHIAHAHYVNDRVEEAVANAKTLAAYFGQHIRRFQDIIQGQVDPNQAMKRPHVRFDGGRLEEVQQKWAHTQNDALGYFLWFYCKLARDHAIESTGDERELLVTFARYFHAIRFWQDEDSGHWEERRKISASSIGVVVGALKELRGLLSDYPSAQREGDIVIIDNSIVKGTDALNKILPEECVQEDDGKRRPVDAALLFLIYPMRIVDFVMADRILADVTEQLQGDYGIRRYRGDSYWCADYKKYLSVEKRTVDFSDHLEARDVLLEEGEEAQWCVFDPIMSVIYGERYQRSGSPGDLERQVMYFNRSLGQLTGEDSAFGPLKCPEAYYIEDGRYVPNDHTPLLWTQANLWAALKAMGENLR